MDKHIQEILDALSGLGCCNHSCYFNPPKGMGTTGPCSCLDLLRLWQRYMWQKEAIQTCNFCSLDEDERLYYEDDYGRVIDVGIGLYQELVVSTHIIEADFKINYCPMCGKRLVE